MAADALGWWVKGDSLPALVTTSPIGTPSSAAGVLGEPGTSILYGNQKVNDGIRPGGRIMGGIAEHERTAHDGAYRVLVVLTYSAVMALPVLLLLYGAAIVRARIRARRAPPGIG